MSSRPASPVPDRRTNLVLRALIDDMLERIRELNQHALTWSEVERERAEAALEDVMARVRRLAAQGYPVETTP